MKAYSLEKRRTSIASLFLFLWVAVVAFQLFKVQVLEYMVFSNKIRAQTLRIMDLHSKRGTISDCRGEILAISIKTKSAFLTNKDANLTLKVFLDACRRITLSSEERQRIVYRIRRGERFIWIKRKLPEPESRALAERAQPEAERGIINFVEEYRRVYPQGNLASHVLGGVGIDEQPLGGIELYLDNEIRGRGGKIRTLMDARKKVFDFKAIEEPIPGKNVILSIDASLQFIVERELRASVQAHRAKAGAVIVLDSRTGAVLAMASFPDYSPEDIHRANPEAMRNRAISFLYDPGSTFKIVLAASALENSVSAPLQVFYCFNGSYPVRDRVISDVHPFNQLTFQDIFIHSSNIGAVRIGERLGSARYYSTIRDFGFGSRTGVALPGEENGILNPVERWTPVSLAFVSHGYEISVTPLQMARAFNTLASGGMRQRPEILQSVDGKPVVPGAPMRILKQQTVQQLVSILDQVVERGTGAKARLENLAIAGKTGTAQKMKEGKYSSVHISSFGGFFPALDPKVTIFVMIDEPVGDFFGGDVAAPLFRSIAEKILTQLDIFPLLSGESEIYP